VSHPEQNNAELVWKALAMHAMHWLVPVGVEIVVGAAVGVDDALVTTPLAVMTPSAVLHAELIRDEMLIAEHAVENAGAMNCVLPPT